MGDKNQGTVPRNSSDVRIKDLWDAYLAAGNKRKEKTEWFEAFIAEFLALVKDGKTVKDILNSSGTNRESVSTLISCELIVNVHKLSLEPGDNDEFEPLSKYLLFEGGWRSLAVLQHLGVQNVTWPLQLAKLLISIYPESTDDNSDQPTNPYVNCGLVESVELYRSLLQLRFKSRSATYPETNKCTPVIRSETDPKIDKNEESSDLEDLDVSKPRKKKKCLKVCFDPMDLDYITSNIKSGEEALTININNVGKRTNYSVLETVDDERIKDVLNHQLSYFNLKMLVIDLLLGLVQSDNEVCSLLLNFSLETLSALEFGSYEGDTNSVTMLKCALSRLLLASSGKATGPPEMTQVTVEKGILPMMLRLVENILRKNTTDFVNTIKDPEQAWMTNEYIFNVVYGIIVLVKCFLVKHDSGEKIEQFLSLFQQFNSTLNGRLIEKSITTLLSCPNVNIKKSTQRANCLIMLVSQLITTLKKTRTKIVHARQCQHLRHKKCPLKTSTQHHDDIFGRTHLGTKFSSSLRPACSISSLYITLTKFLVLNVEKNVIMQTLKFMTSCGTCCCFPPSMLLDKLAPIIESGDKKLTTTSFQLLEKIFYQEIGAHEVTYNCVMCDRTIQQDCQPNNVSCESKQSKWSFFTIFKDLLLTSDCHKALSIGSHLLKIIPFCKRIIKKEIMFNVFYPTFITACHRFSETSLEIDNFLIRICLAVFTNLLTRASFVEQFLELEPMPLIMELLKKTDTMKLCCSVMEIIIFTKIWKIERTNVEQSPNSVYYTSIASIDEFEFLLQEINKRTSKCLKIMERMEDNTVPLNDGIVFTDDTINFGSLDIYKEYCELIDSLTCLWRTLANLSVFSPLACQSLQERTTTVATHELMITVLRRVSKKTSIKDVALKEKDANILRQLHIKLVQPLLILCVVCPPAADNPETFLSCEELIEQLRPLLLTCTANGLVSIQLICDMLYDVSMTNPSSRLLMPTYEVPKLADLMKPCESSISQSSTSEPEQCDDQMSNEESTFDEATADDGYDADVEVKDQSEQTKASDPAMGLSVSLESVVQRKHVHIRHPQLCSLAVDLVSNLVQSDEIKKKANKMQLIEAANCIDKLTQEDCHLLPKYSVVTRLLTQFSELLSSSDHKYFGLQKSILNQVSKSAKQTIEPHELVRYLRFFTLDNPPLETLMSTLADIVSDCQVQPNYALMFPAVCEEHINVDDLDTPAEKVAARMRQEHIAAGLESSWSCCALALPINTDLNWNMWVSGYSVSFWMKLHPFHNKYSTHNTSNPWDRESPDQQVEPVISEVVPESSVCSESYINTASNDMHLLSVGYDIMILELWVNVITGRLVLRLVRPDGCQQDVLSNSVVKNQLLPDKWHNIAYNVKDTIIEKKTFIQVLLIINGSVSVDINLELPGILVRKCRPACILLGHSGTSENCFLISTVLIFRAPVFNRENATRLIAHGPDFTHLTEAEVGNIKPNLSTVMTGKSIRAGVNWQKVFSDHSSNLRELQENLLLAFSAEHHFTVNVYPRAFHGPQGMSALLLKPPSGFRVESMDNRTSQFIPMSLRPTYFVKAMVQHYHGFTVAANTIGGISVFLFLFARVVELGGSDESQAHALYVLLKLSQSSCELNSQFESRKVSELLCHVLRSNRCSLSHHLLKAYLDVCCDQPGLLTVHKSSKVTINTTSSFVLTEPKLLLGTVEQCWRHWSRTPRVLNTLLQSFHALLSDNNLYKEFNSYQFGRGNFVDTLLLVCKEWFVSDEPAPPLEVSICSSIVDLIRIMVGNPPNNNILIALMEYLVLVHPPELTNVTTVRSRFYFTMTNEATGRTVTTPITPEHQPTSPVRRSKSKLNDIYKLMGPSTSKGYQKQPVDANMLNKALSDLQAQQQSSSQSSSETSSESNSPQKQKNNHEISSAVKLNSSMVDYSNDEFPSKLNSSVEGGDNEIPKKKQNDTDIEENNVIDVDKSKRVEYSNRTSKCASVVSAGLLAIITDVVELMPDTQDSLPRYVNSEMLLMLVNHPDAMVRTAVAKLLSVYLTYITELEETRFIRYRGYYHLANQLGLWPITEGVVNSVVAMVTKEYNLTIVDQLRKPLPTTNYAAMPPLLALLLLTLNDFDLAHNVIYFILRIYKNEPQGQRALMECGLIETLCKALFILCHTSQPDLMTVDSDSDSLIADIHEVFLYILSIAINSFGLHHMQVLTDIMVILWNFERKEGNSAQCLESLRISEIFILSTALQLMDDKFCERTPCSIRRTPFSIVDSVMPGIEEFVENLRASPLSSSSLSLRTSSATTSQSQSNKRIPQSELDDRLKMIVTKATEFFICSDSNLVLSKKDCAFAREIYQMIMAGMDSIVEGSNKGRNIYESVVWSCRDTFRLMAGKMLLWMLSPDRPMKLRMYVIHCLRNNVKTNNIFLLLTVNSGNSQLGHQFVLYFWELMYGKHSSLLSADDKKQCEELKRNLQIWQIFSSEVIGHEYHQWHDDVAAMTQTVANMRSVWVNQQESRFRRAVYRMEPIVKEVSDSAVTLTQILVDTQNHGQKKMMEYTRKNASESFNSYMSWNTLAQQLTHERAVWHFPEAYPRSWQLDETEGPARVRKRLKRCHLNIQDHFFKADFRNKLEAVTSPQPLSYLFGPDSPSMAAVLIERFHADDKIKTMTSAAIITPSHEVNGELLIGVKSIYFVPDTDISKLNVSQSIDDVCSQTWNFEYIKDYINRRYQLQERALEIFLLNGKTYLLAFESPKERDKVTSVLDRCELPYRITRDHLSGTVERWREGQLTNWEYLTTLNKLAGRTYNDLMQYPVMPFVLADYTSTTLDLTDPRSYRNFMKPMAVQEESNEQHYIDNYEYLLNDVIRYSSSTNQESYHYSSHYSNSGTILHFLVRLPPFTSMFINYQDDNFDLPDRTFHSIHTTWRLSSSDSPTDVKELIPEFFFLPEFLANNEGFDFGRRQNGSRVDAVELPLWAGNDPRRFVLIHGQALESDYVRENLPHWIDLVFGYKQTGKEAVDAINLFHPATYYGFDLESIEDPVEKTAWETMVKTCGQTPRQLFCSAHPMVVRKLVPGTTPPSVTTYGVKGLSWGNYVGSPSDSAPSVLCIQRFRTPITCLVPLRTHDVFGLAPATTLLLSYKKGKTASLTKVNGVAVVSWGHADGIFRAKTKKEDPPYPAIRPPCCGGPVTRCVSIPECNQLWLGYACGKIFVYIYRFVDMPSKAVLKVEPEPTELLGHNSPILSLSICRAYSVALSSSQDGSVILWDINRLTYVRSLPNISLPVTLTCVSEVSGDLVTVGSDTESGGATVRLHTINVALVGSLTTRENITSVCFSNAPEGISINVVATGMSNGVIKLWSTWDLSLVGELTLNTIDRPIVALAYSHDSMHLYASTDNGSVIIWEGSAAKRTKKIPRFHDISTLK